MLEGPPAERDHVGDGSTPTGCGEAPDGVPRRLRSACFSRFDDTRGFADRVREGPLGP